MSRNADRQRKAHTARTCRAPRPGQKCSHCRRGRLAYDGLLQLSCPLCGYVAEAGGFT
ncbi:MAG: hypothetical protein RMK99_02425 [Anaerolineales bacterium]|nr:hypothetical protein [Anaerolineales bacterium]